MSTNLIVCITTRQVISKILATQMVLMHAHIAKVSGLKPEAKGGMRPRWGLGSGRGALPRRLSDNSSTSLESGKDGPAGVKMSSQGFPHLSAEGPGATNMTYDLSACGPLPKSLDPSPGAHLPSATPPHPHSTPHSHPQPQHSGAKKTHKEKAHKGISCRRTGMHRNGGEDAKFLCVALFCY